MTYRHYNTLYMSTLLTKIITTLGYAIESIDYLDTGSTSEVWRVQTEGDPLVVRLAKPHDGKSACFEGEAGLRAALCELDARVARPIATSGSHPQVDAGGIEWAVDAFVAGEILERGKLPRGVCHDLGEVLTTLHSIPAFGYGMLQNQRDRVCGMAGELVAGICTRLQDPWPFAPVDLREHPIAEAAPHLLPRIEPYRARLLELVDNQPCVPLHTDLHERQMPTVEGRLNGLLDFGDAMVGPVVCDIGSFMGFHGRAQTVWLLEGYTADEAARRELLEQAHLWGIVVSLHHASRAVTLDRPARMARVVGYLESNLGSSSSSGYVAT